MGSKTRQYLFGLIFIGVGIYELIGKDYLEFSLYATAGAAFIINALTLEPKLESLKKPLAVLTWILIASAAVLCFYVFRYRF